MAACGVDCTDCASYRVTMFQDLKAAEMLVDWCRSQGWIESEQGAQAVVDKAPLCRGCWTVEADDCFFTCGCGSRDFRLCCIEQHIEHCGDCKTFPCSDYLIFTTGNETHQKAMKRLITLKKE